MCRLDPVCVYHYGMANPIQILVFPLDGSLKSWLCDQQSQGELSQVVMPAVSPSLRGGGFSDCCIGIDQFCRNILVSEHTPQAATELDIQMALWGSVSKLDASGYLRPACRYPGNISSLSHTMAELARHQVGSSALIALAESFPHETIKLHELARLGTELRRQLQTRGRMLAGDLWQTAAERIETAPVNLGSEVCFTGFERAPYALISLITACAKHASVKILVEGDLNKPQWYGALQSLVADLNGVPGVECLVQLAKPCETVTEWLIQVLDQPVVDTAPPDAGQLMVLDAPSPIVEAEILARELCRTHRAGLNWSEMCVMVPNLTDAQPAYELAFNRLGIPYQLGSGSLLDHPHVRFLMLLVQALNSFDREDALHILRQDLLHNDIFEIERLRRAARDAGVKSGLVLLQLPASTSEPLWSDAMIGCCERLSEQVVRLQSVTNTNELVELIRQVAAQWGMCGDESEENSPVDVYLDVLTQFVSETELELHEISSPLAQVMSLVSNPSAVTGDKVQLVLQMPSMGQQYPFVAITSLVEGVMPHSSREHPLIGDDLREAMAQLFHRRLPLSHESSDHDRLQFLRGIASSSQSLCLSFSRTAGDRESLPSYLLNGVLKLLPKDRYQLVERRLHETSYPVTELVSESDCHLRIVERLFSRELEIRLNLPADELPLLCSLAKRAVKLGGELTRIWTDWSIWPRLPKLIPQASRPVRREFGVSELQQLLQCRFRHYARWQLGLRSADSSAMTIQGRWVHDVLRNAVQQNQYDVETLLKEAAEQMPADLHRGEQTLLYEDTGTMCLGVLDREQRIYTQFGLTPTLFEAAFGRGDDPEDASPPLPGQTMKPLSFPLDEGQMRIAGRLDRVDVCPTTGLAVLVDYKRSVPRDWFDRIAQGDDIQLPIYISALQNLFGMKVGAVTIDNAVADVRYRVLLQMNIDQDFQQRLWQRPEEGAASRVGNDMWWRLMYQNVASKLKQSAALLASGDILPVPGDWCAGCYYQHLCRTTQGANGAVHDGERYPVFG